MIRLAKIDDLLNKVDSKYTLVHLASERAREIINYYKKQGQGVYSTNRPRVQSDSNKPLSIALDEIAEGHVVVQTEEQAKQHMDDLIDEFSGDAAFDNIDKDAQETDTSDEIEIDDIFSDED